jgi:DNA invertase Pin-like site-specific DNA recombinase
MCKKRFPTLVQNSFMEKYISYVRTSTGRQVLGLDEQKSKIKQFIQSTGDHLIEIVTEQESGKKNNRPRLDYGISLCIRHGYTLLFTKLDRLSREVEFLFTLRNRGVKLRCIELPELNTLTLGIFGTMAQYEREMISTRTKNALAELKKVRKLGTPRNLTPAAQKKAVETIVRNRIENENWKIAQIFIEHYQMKNGFINLTEISRQLNEQGYKTRNGCQFTPAIVKRLT